MKTPAILLAASLGWMPILRAADPAPEPEVTAADIDTPRADEQFLVEACQGNAAEIKLADLALVKSQNPEVKKLAETIKSDHTAAQKELHTVAGGLNVTLPDAPSDKQEREYERLSKLEGGEFDEAYLRAMERDHRDTVRTYEKAASDTDTPVVRAYAERTLESLKKHHEHVQRLADNGN